MVKPTLKTEIGPPMPTNSAEVNPVKPTNTTPENVSRRSKGSMYKHDLEERLRESLDRIKSKSFDDEFHLPEKIPNVRLLGMLQCCFKKKRRFFRRTGKIRNLKVCLTKRDNLIIYKKRDKGLILPLSAVKKTSVSTQAFVVSKDRRFMVCRYRLVFDIGTVNLFLANGFIPMWRDALDEVIDKYSRSQYTLPFEQSQGAVPSCTPKNNDARQDSGSQKSLDTISCENRSDRQQAASSTSYRSLKISPALHSSTSQYTEDSVKEPAKSVRHGKRSVASLRARLQRRFCGYPVTRTTGTKESRELPTAVKGVDQNRLVPPMRKGMYSSEGPPPLPTNPPPILPSDSPYISSSMCTKTLSSSPITLKPAQPAVPHPSPQSNKDASESFNSSHLSFSESYEFRDERQTGTVRKVTTTRIVTKPVQSSTPKFNSTPIFEPTTTPKKPPRNPAVVDAEKEVGPKSESAHQSIRLTRTRRHSTAATASPEKFDYQQVSSSKNIVMQGSCPGATRRRDTVRFSISSNPSAKEDSPHNSVSESTQSVRLEDLIAEDTQRSDYAAAPDSLIGDQDDDEWWQHSHAA